ncbi:MAG TPA: methyltransferase [Saprospiraceae bacterium]|nr:methyltransferase [Saprospiraceae bacterium]
MLFRFKKAEIEIQDSVFPVTTDSVLLAAYSALTKPKKVLDLCCGSGLVAVLIGTEHRTVSKLCFVDIHLQSLENARENAIRNQLGGLSEFYHSDLATLEVRETFDLIVVNPPYFEENVLAPNHNRTRQRNQQSLDFKTLALCCRQHLSYEGAVFIVVPWAKESSCSQAMYSLGMQLTEIVKIRHRSESPVSICLLKFQWIAHPIIVQTQVLFDFEGRKSEWFLKLTDNYYLD